MNIAICDDLECERAAIAGHLHTYFSELNLSEYASGADLVCTHEEKQFDLIVLDMLMPGMNGIEIAEKIRAFDERTPIVFATTTEDFLKLAAGPDFCRCHKSFLVNLGHVDAISGENFCLSDGSLLRISRTFLQDAKKAYFDYVFGKNGNCHE